MLPGREDHAGSQEAIGVKSGMPGSQERVTLVLVNNS